MANYLSRPYQTESPVQRGDLNVDFQVLNTLQSRYDANKAIVDQAISQYEMLRGLRDTDNEYIAAKITEAKAQIESFGNIRFEHKSSVDGVLKTLQNVVKDPIVMDAVKSKAVFDNYNSEVSEVKKKNPDKYNDANYQYGLYKAGFQDYMSGKSNSLSNISYTPYTDLNKETLEKIKVIKDVKGKRHVEFLSNDGVTPDPNGKLKVTKEIDGLTQNEINSYFGSMLTSQEISQLQINGWAKYGQPSTKETAKKMYEDYHNQLIRNKEANLNVLKANASNKNLGDEKNKESLKAYEQLKYEVDGLKNLNINSLSSDEISYQLEKMNYVNGLSNMAASEWSTSIDKNDVYYADQELDISRQRLLLEQEKLSLEKIKIGLEYGTDASGNILTDGVVAKSAKSTELEDLTEEGAGAKSLETEHDTAYNSILNTARQFLQNAPKEDKKNFIAYLKSRGVNENLQFDQGRGSGYSLANTVYAAFKDGEFDTTYRAYGEEMENSYSVKQQKAKDILEVRREGFKTTFDRDANKYINSLRQSSEDLRLSGQSDLAEDFVKGNVELSNKIERFAQQAGGWNNIKKYLDENPNKLTEFANLTEDADKAYKGIGAALKTGMGSANPIFSGIANFYNRSLYNFTDANLKRDAAEEIERAIQTKTKSGLMTSVYSDFTFLNDKVKENVLKMIPNERVEGGGILDRSKTANLTFYKKGENIMLTQEQKGEKGAVKVLRVELTPGDAGYNEILKYAQLTPSTSIKADATTDIPAVSVKMRSHTLDTQTRQKKEASVLSAVSANPNIAKAFIVNPAALVTKEKANEAIDAVLETKNIPSDKIQRFKNTIIQNINTYKLKPTTTQNIEATGYIFGLDTYKGDELVMSFSLGTNEITKDLNYLIKTHPQIFILNQLLFEVNNNNIDTITSKL